jgi:hypothetical protein
VVDRSPVRDRLDSAAIANGGTAAGALCFLIGALLLLRDASPPAVPDR